MLKRGSKHIAVFLIYLLIVTIMYTSVVYAQFYGDAHGTDKIPGFRKAAGDVTILNVSVKDDRTPGEIDSNRVVLLTDPSKRFTCQYNNDTLYTDCQTTIPEEKLPGEYSYELQVFNPDMQTPTFSKIMPKLLVDSIAPDIIGFNLEINATNLTVTYAVSDQLCPTCPSSMCSGISKVQLLYNLNTVGKNEQTTKDCFVQNKSNITLPAGISGEQEICLYVKDRLGQQNQECKNFTIDFAPPELINASLWTPTGKLDYYTGNPLGNVKLVVYLKDDSALDLSSLQADLGSFNSRTEFNEAYKNIEGTPTDIGRFNIECKNITGLWECTIGNLLIYPSGANQSITAKFSIKDIVGNKFEQELPLIVGKDGTRPAITNIRTQLSDDRGRYWISPNTNNTIFVDINEQDSGMSKKNLYLDFSQLGPQEYAANQKVLRANNCTGQWTCGFYNVVVSDDVTIPTGDVISVNVVPGSTDDAGNQMSGIQFAGFYYDDVPPQIINYSTPKVCSVYGDDIKIEINVSEPLSGGVNVEFDGRNFSTQYFPQTHECQENEDKTWTCEVIISDLYTIAVEGELKITLSDLAGNKNTTYIPIDVCEAAPGVPPNVVACDGFATDYPIPGGIDRRLATQTAMPLFLKPECNTGAEVQDVTLTGCTIAEGGSVTDSYILESEDPLNPTIRTAISLDPSWVKTEDGGELPEKIILDCGLAFKIRAGNKVYGEPEIENVSFEVPLANQPMGYIDDGIKEKLDDLENNVDDMQKDIKNMEGANYFFGIVCSIALIITLIVQIAMVAKLALLVVAHVVAIFSKASAEKMYQKVACKVLLYVVFLGTYYVWNPPGYGITGPTTGTVFRLVCSFYTCKMADANKLVNIVPALAKTFQADKSNSLSSGSYSYFWQGEDAKNDWQEEGETKIEMDGEGNIAVEAPGEDEQSLSGGAYSRSFYPEPGDKQRDYRNEKGNSGLFNNPSFSFDPWRSINTALSTGCLPMVIYNQKKLRQLKCMKYRCIASRAAAGFDTEVCEDQFGIRKCLYYEGAAYKLLGDDYGKSQTWWQRYLWIWSGELQVMAAAAGTKATCRAVYGSPESSFKGKRHTDNLVITILLSVLFPLSLLLLTIRAGKYLDSPFFDGPIDLKGADNIGCSEKSTLGMFWAGVPCDVMMMLLFVIDTGESVLFKQSWNMKKYFDDLKGTDYCENLDDAKALVTGGDETGEGDVGAEA